MAQGKTTDQTSLYRDRRSFAKIPDVMDVPNLIAIQTDSFEFFKGEGLAQAFQDISPIENNTKDMCVEFGKHEFGEPKYTVDECKEKDVSYQAPLFVEIRFINRETKKIRNMGKFKTLKFECQLGTTEGFSFTDGTVFTLWISDDENKIPLYIESPVRVGSINAYISGYKGLKYPMTSLIK